MAFVIPVSTIRTKVADSMNGAWSITDAADRTYYPDQTEDQEAIDKQLSGLTDGGHYEVYFVVTPGILDNPQKYSTCDDYDAQIPLEITICRRVDDNPHREGTNTLLAQGSSLITAILAISRPWTGTLIKAVTVTQLTTRFPGAEAINVAGYATVRVSFLLTIQLS